jgi:hypothetical protein
MIERDRTRREEVPDMGVRKKKTLLDQATGTVSQYVDQVKPQVESAVATAKDKAGPVLADAKAKAGPVLADAKAKAGPAVATGAAVAAEKIAAGATLAAEKATEAAQAAAMKVEDVTTPEKKKGGKLRKLLVLTGIAALAALIVKRMQSSGGESENWQSSYTPTPAPRAAGEDDPAGASPDEAIADSAEAPHPVTTPEDPADIVNVDDTNK